MTLLRFLIFIQVYKVCADVVFWRAAGGQSVELSCPVPEPGLSHLHLYLRGSHTQTTLLSLARDAAPRVGPRHRGRLRLSGGLRLGRVNATLLRLEPGDTGLYVWEKTGQDGSERSTSDQRLLLLVESTEKCPCSSAYPPLLLTISGAAGLILVIISWIGISTCVFSKQHQHQQHPAPVYVEMSRKEQTVAQDVPEMPSHLEEARFPVYANPHYRAPQDNYYACPRQTGLQAACPRQTGLQAACPRQTGLQAACL